MTVKLADLMIRDPFHTAREAKVEPGSTLADVFKHMGLTEADVPLLATPVAWEKSVIDAMAGGPCARCGSQVWLSPSSARTPHAVTIICMDCLEKAGAEVAKKIRTGGR